MKPSTFLRSTAGLAAAALLAVACGGGEPTATDTATDAGAATATETATSTPTATGTATATGSPIAVDRPERDEPLDYGYVLPETGPLAFLFPPQGAGIELAVEDINAAGGVNGQDVTMTPADGAGDGAIARQAAARLINEGVDVVIGAAASGVSQEIIQLLFDNQIAQCSPANTSPAFTDQENNDFYYRTVPPDQAVAPIIANQVLADGHTNVAVVARADDYGELLRQLVVESLGASGANVVVDESYDPNTTDFSSVVSQITGANADAVVIIGFGEAATLIRQLIEAGVPASALYGGDGLFGPTLDEQVNPDDPAFLEGLTVIGASGSEEFNARLNEVLPEEEQGNLIYGAQSYDCVIVTALAAMAADSTDPAVFIDSVADVTQEGTQCATFEECAGLLEQGEDIDYEGVSGPLEIEGTDPTFGRYAIARFTADGQLEVVGSQDVDLGELVR